MSSSSSSVVPTRKRGWTYDVYLSFRGQDTRYNFVDHLYHALTLKGIRVFRDLVLLGQETISEELVKAIKESRIAVVVLSKNYAYSSWCLEELSSIMECRDQMKVVPVFYHVDPSDIRGQKRDFAMAFKEHEDRFRGEVDKVQKWRAALTAAANLPGQHNLPGYGGKSAFINKIVDEIIVNIQGLGGIREQDHALYSSVVPTRKGGWAHDVFLSFCARDTGNNFSDHLYSALVRERIRVFKHGYARQTVSEDVVKAIEESRFAVVVLSKNYANSSLCLEELSRIMECRHQMGRRVLPVFYHVDPSVLTQEGEFITAFEEYNDWFRGEVDKVRVTKWWLALTAAATLSEIGKGSNGTIVLDGFHGTRLAAVKRIVKAHFDTIASKEIDNLIKSDGHPNIVRYYDVEYSEDFVYIALERCICSLHELILSPTNPTVQSLQLTLEVNGYPSPELLKLLTDTVAGLAHLHKINYIHRDVKPQNVLICNENSSISAKVSDMGISKYLPANKSSLTSATGDGSSGWLAPETLLKERQTRAVDLFNLGCLLFFCITGGRHPFGDNMPERDINIKTDCKPIHLSLLDDIPEAFDLVSNLIQRNPESRPSAAEVYHHPLFWDPKKRLSFLRDASERLPSEDLKTGSGKKKKQQNNNNSPLLKALERTGDVALGVEHKWNDKLDITLIELLKSHGQTEYYSVRGLVEAIRNTLTHYDEYNQDIKNLLGDVPTGFDAYFSKRFPNLLIEVYKVLIEHCGEEEKLKEYYKKRVD
uniref:serine/threonine-protein kinase/endoribonuclease IRE1b-like n=1 Tax=Erigeron canadensis TaxID=72917 RepID=UPI001CB901AF|nr:serine/threonine-protein kinase/endoribonuclease IRE1b-like [Erigeron canadensis]